jgi:hypothetical protein
MPNREMPATGRDTGHAESRNGAGLQDVGDDVRTDEIAHEEGDDGGRHQEQQPEEQSYDEA